MDADTLKDIFSSFGPVRVRRMFGGYGVYADDIMFALAGRDGLFLKADSEAEAEFAAEGTAPFAYETKEGRRVVMSYWQAPDRLLDDADEMALWARKALAAARRAREKSRRKK